MNQKELEEYKLSLEKLSLEKLNEIESELIKTMDEVDKKVSAATFEMPKENFNTVAQAVVKFLDKKTVQWQYTGAMVALADFWLAEQVPASIPYPTLDSTLRVLGELQFTGYEEWAAVIAINKYFEPLAKEYREITQEVYDLASKHDALINEIQKKTPIETNIDLKK